MKGSVVQWMTAAVVALSPISMSAQQSDSLATMRELALVLLTGGYDTSVLKLWRPATGFPPELLEPPVRIVGSLDFREHSRTVLIVPGTPDTVQARLGNRLLNAGWTPPRHSEPTRGGFVMAPAARGGYCKGGESLSLQATQDRPGETTIIVLGGTGVQLCGIDNQLRSGLPMSPIPALYPPYGIPMAHGGTGGGGGDDNWHSRARLSSRRPLAEIMDHYAAQLQKAGWLPGERTNAPSVLVQQWEHTDSTGTAWDGTFLVLGRRDREQRELLFTVLRSR